MRYEICYEPFFHIIIYDVFTKERNKKILEEASSKKKHFVDASVHKGVDKTFRSNKVCYYDELYVNKRKQSIILKSFEDLFADQKFRESLASSPYPLSEFMATDIHETQISRYGHNAKYEYHIDRFASQTRQISIIYYFFKEPKKWEGGQLEITKSPIFDGKEIDKYVGNKIITPQNNMIIVFGGGSAHRVLPTKSPKKFNDGRFSMNCWVGKSGN